MGDVAMTSKATYGGPPRSVVGAPMRGATPPLEWPLAWGGLLMTRSVRRAACPLAHWMACWRATSSDTGTPVAAVADAAGASSTAVILNSLRLGQPSYGCPLLPLRRTDKGDRYTPGRTF